MTPYLKFILILTFASCQTMQQDNAISKKIDLAPYFDVYKTGLAADTTLPNGAFLKFLVDTDTSNHTLYVKYGTTGFDSIIVFEDQVPISNCSTPEFFYATDKSLALVSLCANSKTMTYLPFNHKDSIKKFSPLFIDYQKRTVLFNDYSKYENSNCSDTLTIADFDMKLQKLFVISHLVCGEMQQCIDTVFIDKKKLILKSTASANCDGIHDPTEKIEEIVIPWIL